MFISYNSAILQAFGKDEIQQRIRNAFETSEIIWSKLEKYSSLRLIGQKPGGDTGSLSVKQLINKPVTTPVSLLMNMDFFLR